MIKMANTRKTGESIRSAIKLRIISKIRLIKF